MEEEKRDLCESCRKQGECFLKKGILEREECSEYDPLSIEEMMEMDAFVNAIFVGPCPKCDSDNTHNCEKMPDVNDVTVGYCLDCDAFWCTECGYVFEKNQKKECGHWQICENCKKGNGYLDIGEFIEKVCPSCKDYDKRRKVCGLKDPSKCPYDEQYRCPFEGDITDCPKIEDWLENLR